MNVIIKASSLQTNCAYIVYYGSTGPRHIPIRTQGNFKSSHPYLNCSFTKHLARFVYVKAAT